MYGVPPEGTATKVHEQGEIVLNCNVGMYMLNVIGGGAVGVRRKVYLVKGDGMIN